MPHQDSCELIPESFIAPGAAAADRQVLFDALERRGFGVQQGPERALAFEPGCTGPDSAWSAPETRPPAEETTRRGTAQNKTSDSLGPSEGQFLSDHSTHRSSDDVGGVDACGLKY